MFDRIVVVDWSAANAPKRGGDSIWIADTGGNEPLLNPATRAAAMKRIVRIIEDTISREQRLFIGFDFAFGYPKGSHGLPGGGEWQAVWTYLHSEIEDDEGNRSNRFDVARRLNEGFGKRGPFWGYPHQHHGRYGALPFRRPDYEALGVRERRYVDAAAKAASPPWKLSFTGSVGSQALTGIARLEELRGRFGSNVAVWPFETSFADDLSASVILAEIYPSLWEADLELHRVKDACQVMTLAQGFRRGCEAGRMMEMLQGPATEGDGVRSAALTHEGWMVGFTDRRVDL